MPTSNREKFEERLQSFVKEGKVVNKDALRAIIYETFADEAIQLRLQTVGIIKGKVNLISNLMQIAAGMSDTLMNSNNNLSLQDEFQDEPLAEKVKMLKDVSDIIMRLSSSAKQIEEMSHALNELEKSLAVDLGDTNKVKLFKNVFLQLENMLSTSSHIEDAEIIDEE